MKKFMTVLMMVIVAIILAVAPTTAMSDRAMPNTAIVRIDLVEAPTIKHRKVRQHIRRHRKHRRSHRRAVRKAIKATAQHKMPEGYRCEDTRALCPNGVASDAKLRWPNETATEQQDNHGIFTTIVKIAKVAFLLPILPVLGIGFGAKRVVAEPDLQVLADTADAAEDKLLKLQAELAEKEALAERIERGTEAELQAKKVDAIKARDARRAEVAEAINVLQFGWNVEHDVRCLMLQNAVATEDLRREAKAITGETVSASRYTYLDALKQKMDEAANLVRELRGKVNEPGDCVDRKLRVAEREYTDAERAYCRVANGIASAERHATESGEDALALYNEQQKATAEGEALAVAYAEVMDQIVVARNNLDLANENLNKANAYLSKVKRDSGLARRIMRNEAAAVKAEAAELRKQLVVAKDEYDFADGNYNRAINAAAMADKVAEEEPVTNTAAMPAKRTTAAERRAQAVAHNRRVKKLVYVSAQTKDGRLDTVYADRDEQLPDLRRMAVENVVGSNTDIVRVTLKYSDHEKVQIWQKQSGTWKMVNTLKMDENVVIAKNYFATEMTNTLKKHGVLPMGADHHGHGYMPKFQIVLNDPNGRLCHSELYSTKQAAEMAFNATAEYATAGWQYQLLQDGIVIRRTGDKTERNEKIGAERRKMIITEMTIAGITEARAEKIADYYGIETAKGEGELQAVIESRDEAALTAIKGIGKATAKKVLLALAGKLIAEDQPVKPENKYVDVMKTVFSGSSFEEKVVHVKRGQLYDYLCKISRERGIDPKQHPVYCYYQQKIDRKLKDGAKDGVKEEIKKNVVNGVMHGIFRYLYTLHGTNAAKECTCCLIREDLVADAVGFCTADANPRAKFTVAKLMAYMGLKLVGTDNMPFVFKGEWVHIGKDLHIIIKDRKIMVNGQTVAKVADGEIDQNAFDGAGIMHFSDKVKQEIIDSCKTEGEKEACRRFFRELDAHSGRVLPFMKSMNVVCFDIHKFYHDRGIHQLHGRDIDDIVFFGTKSCFKGSIGPDGTHATWQAFWDACSKYQYHAGMVLHAHDLKDGDLSSQQIQTLAGIKEETVVKLVKNAANRIFKLMNGENLHRLVGNGKLADLLGLIPQLAAEEDTAKRLQEGFERIFKVGLCGKLFGESTSAFVMPDPIALATWLAYEDESKVEYAIKPWEIVTDDPRFEDGQKVVISRNPCTDLSGLCVVTVRKGFGKYSKYFSSPYHVIFTSVLDTTATRLRMDYDGDHIVIVDDPDFVAAVEEAVRLWYPGEVRHPVIDWVAPEAKKIAITEEDIERYFINLTDGDELGRYMDLLTKLYNSIAVSAVKIDDDVKAAVAWLTYAVNVLVDASKHGGEKVEMPPFVQKFANILMSKAVADGKAEDGKDVDWNKVQASYGAGILDTIAVKWLTIVPRTFRLNGCDYNKQFDPRMLLSECRAVEAKSDDLIKACKSEMNSVQIYNLVGRDGWHFYPYLYGKDGKLTNQIGDAGMFIRFGKKANGKRVFFPSMAEARKCAKKEIAPYIAVTEEKKRTVYDTTATPWKEIPGKWVYHELEVSDESSKPTVTPLFQILEHRKNEAEEAWMADGDLNDQLKAAGDRATMRKYAAWSALQSIRAYAALYGYGIDAALDKILMWAWRPREEKDERPNAMHLDYMLDVFGDILLKRAEKFRKYNVIMVQFAPGGKQYAYLTKDLMVKGQQVVVQTADGENRILEVVAAGIRTREQLDAYLPFDQFKWAEPTAA